MTIQLHLRHNFVECETSYLMQLGSCRPTSNHYDVGFDFLPKNSKSVFWPSQWWQLLI